MPEHFHLLATGEKGKNIEKFTHGFRRSVSGEARKIIIENDEAFQAYCRTKKVNCRSFYFKTAGKSDFRFWKEKPRIFPMDREKDILRIMQYIHNNPSRRGLVENNVDWQHSSCRYYETGEKGRIEVGWK
jgi:REP element-mobilizing transposase RayT